jgi:hypothetical protein
MDDLLKAISRLKQVDFQLETHATCFQPQDTLTGETASTSTPRSLIN